MGAVRAHCGVPVQDSGVTAVVGVDLDAIIGQPLRTTTVGAIAKENAIQLIKTSQIDLEIIIERPGSGEWMAECVGVAIGEGRRNKVAPGWPGRGHRFSEREIRLGRVLPDCVRGAEQELRKNSHPRRFRSPGDE